MVKTALLGLFTLLCVSSDPTLTIDPVPPTQGGTAKISYSGPVPVEITVRWSDADGDEWEESYTIDKTGSVKIDVPEDAEGMTVIDESGLADAAATVVVAGS